MTYAQLTTQLKAYLNEVTPGANFTTALPNIVNNAELRIYRELDFLATRGQNRSVPFTAGNRLISFSPMTGQLIDGTGAVAQQWPVVVQGLAAIVSEWEDMTDEFGRPITDEFGVPIQADYPTIVRFLPVSVDWIDTTWPREATTGVPGQPFAYFAMLDDQTAMVAPTPDIAYTSIVTGTWRPAPMSDSNTTTWLGTNLPDLLFIASMVEGLNFQRNVTDPQKILSWEQRYQDGKTVAFEEEQRRKAMGPSAQPYQPSPELQQTRA